MQYIIHATNKKPDDEKGIVTIKTDKGLKKLYLVDYSVRGDSNLLSITSDIIALTGAQTSNL